MRTLIKICLMILTLCNNCFAQGTSTFNKFYNSYNAIDISSSTTQQTSDSGFVLNFGSSEFNVLYSELNFIKVNKSGIEQYRKTIHDSLYTYSANGLFSFSTGGYISACSQLARVLPEHAKEFLVRYNNNGDTLWTRLDSIIKYSYYLDLLEAPNYKIATIGSGYDTLVNGFPSRNNAFIAIYDSSGNGLSSHIYSLPGGSDSFDAFAQTPDNGFLIAGRSFIGVSPNTSCRAWLVKTDSTGAFQFQKIWTATGNGVAIVAITTLSDGNYLVSGDIALNSNYYDNVGMLRKIDAAGNIIWSKTYEGLTPGPKGFFNCKELSDKSIIACGYSYNVNPNDNSGYILKADSLGNVIWEREFNPDINEDYFLRMNTCNDGGFIINGTSINFSNDSTQDVWMVKVDSLGCDSMGCAVYTSIEENNTTIKNNLISVFPNPANTIITIRLNNEIAENIKLLIQIYDVSGKEVSINKSFNSIHHQYNLNISNIENGIYFIRVSNENALIGTQKFVINH